MSKSKRILLTCKTSPPYNCGSAIVVANLSKGFSKDEMVIVGERPPFGNASGECSTLFVGNAFPLPRRGARFLRWLEWMNLAKITKCIQSVAMDQGITDIVGVFPDGLYFTASYRAAEALGLPFYPYMHNTWSHNQHGLAAYFSRQIESFVFRRAEKIFTISDGLKLFYENAGLERQKIVTVPHAATPSRWHCGPMEKKCNSLRFVFLGNLNDSNLDAFKRMAKVCCSFREGSMSIITSTPRWFFEKHKIESERISFIDIPHWDDEALMQELFQSSICLLPHGLSGGFSEIEYKTIFPTRTIPYLLSGTPILAHAPEGAFLTDWLTDRNCARIVTEASEEKIRSAIIELISDASLRDTVLRNAAEAAKEFDVATVSQILRNSVLDK